MDPKQILDVPDTPDRVRMPMKDVQDMCSPISYCLEDSCLAGEDCLNMIAGRNMSATEIQCEGRSVHRGRDIDISERTGNGRGSVVSVNRHSSAFENASLFRKVGSKSFKPDGRYHLHSKHADNRKDVHLKFSSKPVNHPEHKMARRLMGGNTDRFQKSSLLYVQKESKASKSKEDPLVSNSLYHSEDPSKAKSSANKGKAKINNDVCKAVPSDSDQRKRLYSSRDGGSEQRISSHVPFPVHSVTSSRVAGQKRLVRNGCISPHNIARSKQAVESSSNCTRDLKWTSTNKTAKIDPSNEIDVEGELTGGSTSNQVKGKGIVTHCFSSGEHDAETRDLSKRVNGPVSFREQENRSLHSCDKINVCSNSSHGSSSSSLASGIDPSMNQKCRANTSKRQKKYDLPLSSQDREEIIFIDSCSKPSSSGSQAECSQLHPFPLENVIEIDEFSPKIGCSKSRSENDLEARARQVEADEMLARELQEQLYHEMPENGSAERDSQLAWMLQQEENVQQGPRSRNSSVNLRVSSSSQVRRQSHSQLFRNQYQRGGGQARAPISRLTRLRNSMQRTSRLFPLEMDLDVRIELLEALEAVNDDISRATQLLDSNREFTENDYDMLLALDENNHEHLGASSTQISNLPESIVQTDNCESCPICLEEPAVGETIRHLPCLHKFHKHCIDSWLRRRRFCPVCKSDIT